MLVATNSTEYTTPISMDDAQSMDSADLLLEAGDLNLISVSHDDESKFYARSMGRNFEGRLSRERVYWED